MVNMVASVAWLLLLSGNAFAWSKVGLVGCKAKDYRSLGDEGNLSNEILIFG
jgi:hypothetical protein